MQALFGKSDYTFLIFEADDTPSEDHIRSRIPTQVFVIQLKYELRFLFRLPPHMSASREIQPGHSQ